MAKQANRMMIGVFVVIAVFIMAASLVVFGSGKFFQKTVKCVLYFDESVKGLTVGAPVLFEGVQIGSVLQIVLEADLTKSKIQIPVIIEYEPAKFKVVGEESRKIHGDPQKNIPKLIEKGLRAQLGMQSFITGQLVIEIGFYPEKSICYAPARFDKEYKDYIVIPTCLSTTERLAKTLDKMDISGLIKNLEATMTGANQLVNDPALMASIREMQTTLEKISKLSTKLERQVDPLAKDVKKTTKDFGKLANDVDSRVKVLAASLEKSLLNLDKTMSGFDKTMSTVRGVISPDAPLVVDLENSLKEITAMSRSIRELSDYLEQHPGSLIFGKKKSGGK
jgi:paraquat-inducible protein B